jgi:hypothetical protein
MSVCGMFIANTCGRELRMKGCRTTEQHKFIFRIPHMYIQYCSKYRNPTAPVHAFLNRTSFTAILVKTGLYVKFYNECTVYGWQAFPRHIYEWVSRNSRTEAIAKYTIPNKRVWKLPTFTQLCASWHTVSLEMVALPSTSASRYHNCCIDGGVSPEYFGCTLICAEICLLSRRPVYTFAKADSQRIYSDYRLLKQISVWAPLVVWLTLRRLTTYIYVVPHR